MKRLSLVMSGVFALMVCAISPVVRAEVIDLFPSSASDLVGPNPVIVRPLQISEMHSPTVDAEIYSEVLQGIGGQDIYLYQIHNTGAVGKSSIELFNLAPFAEPLVTGDVGYITGPVPDGFVTSASRVPEPTGYVDPLIGGDDVSFYFDKRLGYQVGLGQASAVLYLTSDMPRGTISSNIIGSSGGSVYGAVPEPSTLALLAASIGAMALAAIRRRLRSR